MSISRTLTAWRPALLLALCVTAVSGGDPITYHGSVRPLFRDRCMGCHRGEKAKAGLDLSTYAAAMKGGEDGAALVQGKPGESLLYQLVTQADKPFMPPRKQGPLDGAQTELIRRWIKAGCAEGEPPREIEPYTIRLKPPVYRRPAVVTALEFSRDGELLYVSGYKEILVHRLDRVPARYPAARLLGESEQIHALRLSPDGRFLAAAGGNPARFGELQIWDVESRSLRRFIRVGKDTLFAVAFDPEGRRAAVAGADRSLRVLSLESGEELFASELHADWVFGVAFNADGTKLVSGGRDRSIKISSAADGKFIKNLANFDEPILRLAGLPGSDVFVCAGGTREPVLFDASKMKELRKLESQPGEILAAALSADGKSLAVAGAYDEVRVYTTEDGKRVASFKTAERWVYALAFRPDGKRLAVGGFEGVVRIFDLEKNSEESSFVPVPIGAIRAF